MDGHYLKPGSRPPFPKHVFTWCIFGNMFLKFGAPEGQKRSAATVQRILFCKLGIFTAQVAPFYIVGCNPCVIGHT
jgi:hypothetical protein